MIAQWQTSDGVRLAKKVFPLARASVALSPDGRLVAGLAGQKKSFRPLPIFEIYNAQTGALLHSWNCTSKLKGPLASGRIKISPDNLLLYVHLVHIVSLATHPAEGDEELSVWDIQTQRLIKRWNQRRNGKEPSFYNVFNSTTFSFDGQKLFQPPPLQIKRAW